MFILPSFAVTEAFLQNLPVLLRSSALAWKAENEAPYLTGQLIEAIGFFKLANGNPVS
jgi:hypothetical protein